jgi:lycopene cyclase domain-containing protein
MPDRYLYLLINLGTISVPLMASFYPRAHFASTWRRILPALVIPLVSFIIWDVYFTRWGVWGFHDRYLTGVRLIGLPLEEWLFFVTVPYACLFTYFALKHLVPLHSTWGRYVAFFLSGFLLLVGMMNLGRLYTSVTFIALGATLLYLALSNKQYLSQFFFSFIVCLLPFFIVNGLLTGSWIDEQVVWYNNAENLGIRMGTIPFEDTFYGMLLLLWNVVVWEKW